MKAEGEEREGIAKGFSQKLGAMTWHKGVFGGA